MSPPQALEARARDLAASARAEAREQATISFGGCSVSMRADRLSSLRWASDYLRPLTSVSPPDRDAYTVYYCNGFRLLEDAHAIVDTCERECSAHTMPFYQKRCARRFDLSNLAVYHPGEPNPALGGNWLFPIWECYLHLAAERAVYAFAQNPAATADRPTELPRVARDLVTRLAARRGLVFLHGSAVAVHGSVVAFAGHRGAGKTTTLLACLDGLPVELVCNDRVAIGWEGGSLRAWAWPTAADLLLDTVRRFPRVQHRLESLSYPQQRFWSEALVEHSPSAVQQKLGMTFHEIAAAFDRSVCPSGPLQGVFFLDRRTCGDGLTIRELASPAEAAGHLAEHAIPSTDDQYPNVFGLCEPDGAVAASLWDAIATDVRSWVVESPNPADTVLALLQEVGRPWTR